MELDQKTKHLLKKYRKTDVQILPYLKKQILSHTDLIKTLRVRSSTESSCTSRRTLAVIRCLKRDRMEWIYRYEKAKQYRKRKRTHTIV